MTRCAIEQKFERSEFGTSFTFLPLISKSFIVLSPSFSNIPTRPYTARGLTASKGPLLASNSNRQRLVIFRQFRHFRHCMHGDFCQNRQFRQNRHFRQNRQPPRGHFWHPIQIASGWRFFASFAIFAIACISGHKCGAWSAEPLCHSHIILVA